MTPQSDGNEPNEGLPDNSPRDERDDHTADVPKKKKRAGQGGIYKKPSRQTGKEFYYGDFRQFADVGGGLEALHTDDFGVAAERFVERTKALKELREAGISAVLTAADMRLGPMLELHLRELQEEGQRRPGAIKRMEVAARQLLKALGNPRLSEITTLRVKSYVTKRLAESRTLKSGRVVTTNSSVRNELALLSAMSIRGIAYGYMKVNPAADLPGKPTPPKPRQDWLNRIEGGRLLDAAAEHDALARGDFRLIQRWQLDANDPVWSDSKSTAKKQGRSVQWEKRCDFAEAIIATLAYSGGRIDEVLGLQVDEIDFVRNVVVYRHNQFRKLKHDKHARDVELWPALARTLRCHIDRNHLSGDMPLFPTAPGEKRPITRIDKLLARCCRRANLDPAKITAHALRHTFATQLLRTYTKAADGSLVQRSNWDVAQQLGHTSTKMVDSVYAHATSEELVPELSDEKLRNRTQSDGD